MVRYAPVVAGMLRRSVLMVVVGSVLVAGCSNNNEGAEPDAPSASTQFAGQYADTLPWTDTVPQFAYPPPVSPLIMTLTDDEGKRCLEVRKSTGDIFSLCADEPEKFAVSATEPDIDGTVYLIGLTADRAGSYVIASAGTSALRIEPQRVIGWPEQAFAAPLPFAPDLVELFDEAGVTIAREQI